ncbi:hypothetical protein [Streptomyces sp. NPDC012510]|uniref:hypothetical protein n=1 Tax=Streptomyces sp. NPDC012510 TaxID=3364838 RepID=UPI0036E67B62
MLWGLPGRPNGKLLRRALRHWAFVVPGPGQGGDADGGPAGAAVGGEGGSGPRPAPALGGASRPLVDLHDPVLARDVLESLRRKLDGGEAAVETMRRKRKVLVHALHCGGPTG